jgi:hypothetical protein
VAAEQLFFGAAVVDGVGGDLLEDSHVLLFERNVPSELATAAQTVVGVGVKVACHGGGRSLDEDPLFLFCVCSFRRTDDGI